MTDMILRSPRQGSRGNREGS